jgi:hypothetical protein
MSSYLLISVKRRFPFGTKWLVSSKAFLDRLKLKVPAPTLLLEEVLAQPRLAEKLTALALSWLLPARGLEKALGCLKPVQCSMISGVAQHTLSCTPRPEPIGAVPSEFRRLWRASSNAIPVLA